MTNNKLKRRKFHTKMFWRHPLLLVVVAGLFSLGGELLSEVKAGPLPVKSMSTEEPISSPSPRCSKKLQITSPAAGVQIYGPEGRTVKGRACDLSEESGSLWDYDPEDGYYYLVTEPPITSNGDWARFNKPIGDPGDDHKTYQITLVRASKACNDQLVATEPDEEGTIKRQSFPPECIVDDSRDIIVTYPDE